MTCRRTDRYLDGMQVAARVCDARTSLRRSTADCEYTPRVVHWSGNGAKEGRVMSSLVQVYSKRIDV